MLIMIGGFMKYKTAQPKRSSYPGDSVVLQVGVAFIVVMGFALLMYVMKYFLP